MAEIKGNLMFLQVPPRYPRNIIAELFCFYLFYMIYAN
jgi:hypothetical protein